MEQTPPELVADIEKNGLLMTGGGAMLDGLDKLITSRVRIRAHLAENPIRQWPSVPARASNIWVSCMTALSAIPIIPAGNR